MLLIICKKAIDLNHFCLNDLLLCKGKYSSWIKWENFNLFYWSENIIYFEFWRMDCDQSN